MTTGLKDAALAGLTVEYNGVQFGGGDAAYQMMPPTFSFQGAYVYDEADRVVTHTRYTLTVNTIVYHDSESQQSAQMRQIRERLSHAGHKLKVSGLGFGFDDELDEDIIWGAKPRAPQFAPVGGDIATELVWVCEFNISECQWSGNIQRFMALNSQQTWEYDFEGIGTRTVSGYYEVPQVRESRLQQVADNLREKILVKVPHGFRRINWNVKEDAAKRRIDFIYVDREFTDEAFPRGITEADGEYSVDAQGETLARGSASLSLMLTTAPGIAKSHAGQIALGIALATQERLKRGGECGMQVMVSRMRWSHRLWSRTSRFDFGWTLTGGVGSFLTASGVWHPLSREADGDWNKWSQSIEHLYHPRGVAKLRSTVREDIIISVCDGVSRAHLGLGNSSHARSQNSRPSPFRWACGEIPADGGWLLYDVQVRLLRDENKVIHRSAATPSVKLPTGGQSISGQFKMGKNEESQSEQVGYPRQRVVLLFKALRIHHKPTYPVLTSIGGRAVEVVDASQFRAPEVWGCLAGCKVWFGQSALVYEVLDGHLSAPNEDDYKQDQSLCCTKV